MKHVEQAVNEQVAKTHGSKEPPNPERTKGMIIGAASALSLVGLVALIMQQQNQGKDKCPPCHDGPGAETDVADVQAPNVQPELDGGLPADDALPAEDDKHEGEKHEPGAAPEGEIETVLKDVGTVGTAARGVMALEPVVEALALLV